MKEENISRFQQTKLKNMLDHLIYIKFLKSAYICVRFKERKSAEFQRTQVKDNENLTLLMSVTF